MGRRVLVGFDFPFGYPSGLCQALGLPVQREQAWRAIWREWARLVEDHEDNSNNRFAAAAALNERLPPPPGPFWGYSAPAAALGLPAKKPAWGNLPERRLTEMQVRRTQPVWKLAGVGSVGSQALLGIPRLEYLCSRGELGSVSRVWPFEWGLETKQALARGSVLVLYAEIYPSLLDMRRCGLAGGTRESTVVSHVVARRVRTDERFHLPRDAEQVQALVHLFAEADRRGDLETWLDAPLRLPEPDRRVVMAEEGWILGVPVCVLGGCSE
ncbi:MAG: hypothetical protein N3B14_04415 [Thermoleophilia bacterium]|nr:hypothetical protein [Thermoleophilia bacterium]